MLELLASVGSTSLLKNTEADGRETAIVSRPDAAAIVVLRPRPGSEQPDDSEVLLLSQHRPATGGGRLVEIPAGKVDAGETPLAAAQRELAEEAGVQAARWTPLLDEPLFPSPGYSAERIHIFLARDLTNVPRRSEDAHIQLDWRDFDATLSDQGLADAKTLIGLLRARDVLRGIHPSDRKDPS